MRRRDRGNKQRYELVTRGGTFGPTNKGWVLLDEGEKLVAQGKATPVYQPSTGRLVGFQLASSESPTFKPKPRMDVSETMLTRAEVDAVVGEHCKGGENIDGVNGGPPGRSQTAGLNQKQRKLREILGLETVDFVEASRIKLNAFHPRNGRVVRVEAAA